MIGIYLLLAFFMVAYWAAEQNPTPTMKVFIITIIVLLGLAILWLMWRFISDFMATLIGKSLPPI